MKNTNKGFTLVELLVVIAMLAILSTVTVIGLTGCIEQAKLSVDQQEVEQMNTVLDASKVAGAPETIKELADLLKASDLNTKDGITASASGYAIYWFHNEKYNQIVLAKESDGSVHHPVDDSAMVTAFTAAQQANDASVYNLKKLAIGVFVGDTQYETLAAAIAAEFANSDSVTIDLYNDEYFAEPVTIPAGKSLVLNLNGCSISSVMTENKGSALITNNGTFTINDATGKGLITTSALKPDMKDSPSYANNVINNYGVLILNGGTIENTTTEGYCTYAVDTYAGSTFEMNGGFLESKFDALRIYASGNKVVTVDISGGTITGSGSAIWLQNLGTANVNISGGTFVDTNATDSWAAIHLGQNSSTDAEGYTVEISGGVVTGNIYVQAQLSDSVNISNVTVSGEIIRDNDNNSKN